MDPLSAVSAVASLGMNIYNIVEERKRLKEEEALKNRQEFANSQSVDAAELSSFKSSMGGTTMFALGGKNASNLSFYPNELPISNGVKLLQGAPHELGGISKYSQTSTGLHRDNIEAEGGEVELATPLGNLMLSNRLAPSDNINSSYAEKGLKIGLMKRKYDGKNDQFSRNAVRRLSTALKDVYDEQERHKAKMGLDNSTNKLAMGGNDWLSTDIPPTITVDGIEINILDLPSNINDINTQAYIPQGTVKVGDKTVNARALYNAAATFYDKSGNLLINASNISPVADIVGDAPTHLSQSPFPSSSNYIDISKDEYEQANSPNTATHSPVPLGPPNIDILEDINDSQELVGFNRFPPKSYSFKNRPLSNKPNYSNYHLSNQTDNSDTTATEESQTSPASTVNPSTNNVRPTQHITPMPRIPVLNERYSPPNQLGNEGELSTKSNYSSSQLSNSNTQGVIEKPNKLDYGLVALNSLGQLGAAYAASLNKPISPIKSKAALINPIYRNDADRSALDRDYAKTMSDLANKGTDLSRMSSTMAAIGATKNAEMSKLSEAEYNKTLENHRNNSQMATQVSMMNAQLQNDYLKSVHAHRNETIGNYSKVLSDTTSNIIGLRNESRRIDQTNAELEILASDTNPDIAAHKQLQIASSKDDYKARLENIFGKGSSKVNYYLSKYNK